MKYVYSIKTKVGDFDLVATAEAATARQLHDEILALPNCILQAGEYPGKTAASWYRLIDDDGIITDIDPNDFWRAFQHESKD